MLNGALESKVLPRTSAESKVLPKTSAESKVLPAPGALESKVLPITDSKEIRLPRILFHRHEVPGWRGSPRVAMTEDAQEELTNLQITKHLPGLRVAGLRVARHDMDGCVLRTSGLRTSGFLRPRGWKPETGLVGFLLLRGGHGAGTQKPI